MTTEHKCPKCGTKRDTVSSFCPVCGNEFVDSLQVQPLQPVEATSSDVFPVIREDIEETDESPKFSFRSWIAGCLGFKRLEGNVIHVSNSSIRRGISKLQVIAVLLILLFFGIERIIGFIFGIFLLAVVLEFFGMGGFNLLLGIITSSRTASHSKHQWQIPIKNIRLRDAEGREHTIRIKGEIKGGEDIHPGDEIEVQGFDYGGTLFFKWGRNKRTRAKIKIRGIL